MAGDWIKMRCNLWTHPKVALMAMRTRQPKTMIVGALHGAWGILDQHGEEGVLGGMSADMLDAQVEVEGFAAAMESVGWLTQVDGGLEFPNYEEHNGATAKRRASEAKRKGNVRKASASCPQGVRIPSATRPHRCGHIADKSAHHAEQIREEEKREEEKRRDPESAPTDSAAVESKDADPELLAWIETWNNLADSGHVPHRVKDPNGSAITAGWKRYLANREVREYLEDREAVAMKIRGSPLCRQKWFRMEKLFGAKNGSGALICQVLMEDGYAGSFNDDRTTADAGKRFAQREF